MCTSCKLNVRNFLIFWVKHQIIAQNATVCNTDNLGMQSTKTLSHTWIDDHFNVIEYFANFSIIRHQRNIRCNHLKTDDTRWDNTRNDTKIVIGPWPQHLDGNQYLHRDECSNACCATNISEYCSRWTTEIVCVENA